MKKVNFIVIDLFVFSFLAVVSEFLSIYTFEKLNASFYISLSIMIGIISIVRWGVYGIIPFVFSGIVSFIMNQQGYLTEQPMVWYYGLLYYVLGNVFLMLPLFYYSKNRDAKIETTGKFFLFIVFCFLGLAVGKGLFIFIITGEVDGLLSYLASVGLSFVISTIVLILFKTKTELLLDMRNYVKEQEMEDEYERRQKGV